MQDTDGSMMRLAASALIDAGMRGTVVETKMRTLEALSGALGKVNGRAARGYFVPGRIEVLGKHVDYAGGRSITCATEQGFCLVVAPRDDWRVRMMDPMHNRESSFPLDPELEPLAGDWTNYPMTVARRVARNFHPDRAGRLRGCDIAFSSDLPQAAGLSSSSALIIGMFMAIADVNGLSGLSAYQAQIQSDLDLAGYLGCVENGLGFGTLAGDRGVGTKGGAQDHTAILCAQADVLSCFAYRPNHLEQRVGLDERYVFVIGVSGVHSQKTGNTLQQYNSASQLAGEATALWRQQTGRKDEHLASAAASSPDGADRLRRVVAGADASIRVRVEQFLDETYRIVPGACEALASGDMAAFGALTDDSQRGAETKLGNQVAQTAYLAKRARALGALGASAFGAGFGGSVWALVEADEAEAFGRAWREDYAGTYPTEAASAAFVTTRPGPGAMRLG